MPCDVLVVDVAFILLQMVIGLVSQPSQLFLLILSVMILIIAALILVVVNHGERLFTIAASNLIFGLHLAETGHRVHLLLRLVQLLLLSI